MRSLTITLLACALTLGAGTAVAKPPKLADPPFRKLARTDAEWQQQLTAQQYEVLRHQGTERAFTGKYWNEHRRGVFTCAGCGLELFGSAHKFESGTGWPSFWRPLYDSHVERSKDTTLGMVRDEVRCPRCGGHLGHVFDDGPRPTGLRYCINSASLEFVPAK